MQPGSGEHARPFAVRMFIGPHGLRSGWRVLLFLVLWGALAAGIGYVSHGWLGKIWGIDFPVLAAAAAAATWIAARLEHRPFTSYGLGGEHRWRNLASGLAAGFVAMSVLMALLVAVRAFDPRGAEMRGPEVVRWGLYWAVAFTFTALGEELLTRGYALFALSRGIGFWPAAVLLSLLFGAGHTGNRGEEAIGVANAVLAGMVFAFSVWWRGTLWWAIGCHLAWDWAETFFYGVPNSGSGVAPNHFLSGDPAGPDWLSGGSVGPEGSLLATLVLLLLAAVVRYTTPRNRAAGLGREQLGRGQSHPGPKRDMVRIEPMNFSGKWRFNPEKSALEIPAPESAYFEIEHREPDFRLTRTLVYGGQADTLTVELKTDGSESVQQFRDIEARMRLHWDGAELVFDSAVRTPDDEGTNVVRYSLHDEGQTLAAVERVRSPKLQHDNTWVFDREEAS